ncbi:MAG: sugar transferase, partial [Gemmatimonadaceae bacterium]|nr:sugar transferase [Gemmatimonadaceae bacterium]
MYIVPVLIDEQPSFMSSGDASASLLSMPCVGGTLRDLWRSWLAPICRHVPHEVPRDIALDGEVTLADLLRDPLLALDPFDWVLFVSSRLVPSSASGLEALRRQHEAGDSAVLHLLASSPDATGGREVVYETPAGGVRRIQRYLDPVTTSQPSAGVIASLVPVQSLLRLDAGSVVTTLDDLRTALVQSGVPSTDMQQEGHVFDLGEEEGALAFVHSRVRSARTRVPPSVRARGPVVIEAGAVVADDVLLVGPTLVAAGARVGAGARLAQCIILPSAVVPAGASVRHRISSGDTQATVGTQRRHATASASPATSTISPRRSRYQDVRSWVEAALALVALIVLSPFFALVALAIKLTSSGPVFYGDRREGLGATPFRCWKFRTMRVNAHAMQRQLASQQFSDGPHFKMDRDPRLTPIGGWLRRL